ncbi:peptide chain release factor N(5)-glutamine methyltransferase [Ureaplasma miroungigenitalium]|uniref:peptide chain release factor N(5)-glutamine methyltransferase n=1 Tax=Ureaplasma miroungigenitalium TaxID=1042321 RepID=A0ABT3BNB3_9BACT|nr:HemK/PrmC family methyltransferase [Ureaplasma miroungigenitalium]MCV3728729.1 peptide chain release factor N(5)-glutamine methyltransferase [Ureaplasma miroungigenitalium]MCV3734493.1 peptide chain release factor N(5)-glutamine methyltransferase [Ureaplasma miroungigenitalium]
MTYQAFYQVYYQKACQKNLNPVIIIHLINLINPHITDLTSLYAVFNQLIKEEDQHLFEDLWNQHVNLNIPIERLAKKGFFYHRQWYVDDGVFIFRQASELLVSEALNYLKNQKTNKELNVVDVCCGTGVLGLSVLLEHPINLSCVDINPLAIQNTQKNQKLYNLNAQLYNQDYQLFLQTCPQKFDLLICNPPYIMPNYELSKNVLMHDPYNALVDVHHEYGLSFYIYIIKEYFLKTNPACTLFFEIGYDQRAHLIKFLAQCKIKDYVFKKDYEGYDRILIIQGRK